MHLKHDGLLNQHMVLQQNTGLCQNQLNLLHQHAALLITATMFPSCCAGSPQVTPLSKFDYYIILTSSSLVKIAPVKRSELLLQKISKYLLFLPLKLHLNYIK
jgi:hypothetical protein